MEDTEEEEEEEEEEEGDPVLLMKSPLVWTAAVSTLSLQGGTGVVTFTQLSFWKRQMCIVSYSDARIVSV